MVAVKVLLADTGVNDLEFPARLRPARPRVARSAPSARAAPARVRRGACPGLHDEAFLHGQLHAGGVPHAAVPLVDAAPVGAQQAARNLDRLRRLQAASLDTQRIYTLDFTTMLESRRLYPKAKIIDTIFFQEGFGARGRSSVAE